MFKAGLFSALGAVSIVESYKWLLPDSGDETVGLLVQISQQLANNSQHTASIEPFNRTVPDIMTNVLWCTSIAICIGSATFATLIQQWARRYLALAQGPSTPEKRAAVRKFLKRGHKKFWMPQVCMLLSMALHASIALYSLGFIFFVFHINSTWVPLVVVMYPPIYVVYVIMTVLPIIFWDCPYGTSFTALTWWGWHFGWFVTFSIISGFATLVLPRGSGGSLQNRVKKHRQWASDGLNRSVELYATEDPQVVGDEKPEV